MRCGVVRGCASGAEAVERVVRDARRVHGVALLVDREVPDQVAARARELVRGRLRRRAGARAPSSRPARASSSLSGAVPICTGEPARIEALDVHRGRPRRRGRWRSRSSRKSRPPCPASSCAITSSAKRSSSSTPTPRTPITQCACSRSLRSSARRISRGAGSSRRSRRARRGRRRARRSALAMPRATASGSTSPDDRDHEVAQPSPALVVREQRLAVERADRRGAAERRQAVRVLAEVRLGEEQQRAPRQLVLAARDRGERLARARARARPDRTRASAAPRRTGRAAARSCRARRLEGEAEAAAPREAVDVGRPALDGARRTRRPSGSRCRAARAR